MIASCDFICIRIFYYNLYQYCTDMYIDKIIILSCQLPFMYVVVFLNSKQKR